MLIKYSALNYFIMQFVSLPFILIFVFFIAFKFKILFLIVIYSFAFRGVNAVVKVAFFFIIKTVQRMLLDLIYSDHELED